MFAAHFIGLQRYTELSDICGMTCGELVYCIASCIFADSRTFWTCYRPKNQQISGQNLPVSELVLLSYISGEILCGFRAMCESI